MKLDILTRVAGRSVLQVKKYSPEILTAVGIAGMVTSSVMAAKATLQLEEVVDETKGYLENAQSNRAEQDEESYRKEVAFVYARSAIRIGKLYGPALSLGAASIASIIGAHGIMRRRNAAIIAGYKVLEQTFSEYRKRVEASVGEDQERELYYGLDRVDEVETDGVKRAVVSKTTTGMSQYARFFDELSPMYQAHAEYNLLFLRAQQNYANDLLRSRGHIFLNEVYDMLGIPRSKAGAVTGWVLNHDGDNYVDFGMYDETNPKAREFVNGVEGAILLDFNVDGLVYDLI